MGGFSLDLRGTTNHTTNNIFLERGQKNTFLFKNEFFILKKYGKKLLQNDPYIFKYKDGFVIGNGTLSYKSLSVVEGFNSLSNDLIHGEFNEDELFGHFSIIYYDSKRKSINIYYDKAGYGSPYILNSNYISSSFLDCCDNSQDLHIDNEAVFEEIYTGCYFNDKTTFNEVKKNVGDSSFNYRDINVNFIPTSPKELIQNYKSFEHAVDSSLSILNNYLKRWKPQVEEFEVDLGLSSGYDSRLILSLIENNFNNNDFQLHSYWKKEKYFDNIVGEMLAKTLGKELIQIPISDRNKLTTVELNLMINEAMIYYDGLFPVNHGWVREYRTAIHRERILGRSRFGMSGLSGEQYRNDYNLLNKSYSTSSIIQNIILEDRNNEVLRESNYNSKGISIIKESLRASLDLNNSEKISRIEFQKFYCEMWVSGGPGIRNQVENSLSFFLSPFTERVIQNHAYSLIDYLGIGGRFQARMIEKNSERLASIISDYGFSFDNISIKHEIKGYLSVLLGRKRKINLMKLMKNKSSNYLNNFGTHNELIQSKLDSLEKYNFEFSIKSSKFEADTIDRLIALSTLLKRYDDKIINE